jgi:hypothetical protein
MKRTPLDNGPYVTVRRKPVKRDDRAEETRAHKLLKKLKADAPIQSKGYLDDFINHPKGALILDWFKRHKWKELTDPKQGATLAFRKKEYKVRVFGFDEFRVYTKSRASNTGKQRYVFDRSYLWLDFVRNFSAF